MRVSVILRGYQQVNVFSIREHMREGKKSILLQSPTGSGKTVLASEMLKTAHEKGFRSWFIVHRVELLEQTSRALKKIGLEHGLVASGMKETPSATIQICSVMTLIRRLEKIEPPGLIFFDECQHLAAKSWARVYGAYPNAFKVGLSASPWRLDGKGLWKYFEVMVNGPSVKDLTPEFLSPFKLFAPATIDVTGIRKKMGDFEVTALDEAASKPKITGSAIAEYQKRCDGKRALVFCVSRKHSRLVADEFKNAGIEALHVDGETPAKERAQAMEDFTSGNLKVLCNVDLFCEGVDVPAIESVILLRPTMSLSLHLQQCGRALRPSPGKEFAIILDHAGNTMRHGFPDDEREWSLKDIPKEKRGPKGDPSTQVRVCEGCFFVQKPGPVCINCGLVFKIKYREVQEVSGELIELDRRIARSQGRREQASARDLDSLIQLGRERGYRNPVGWASFVHAARLRKQNG